MAKRHRKSGNSAAPQPRQSSQQPHPPENRQQVTIQQATNWSGPMPPPAALEHFDRVIPGGAERILAMAEKEQKHRTDFETAALTAAVREGKWGQIAGSAIAVLAVGGAIWIGVVGGPWQVAVALVGVPVLGIVKAIISPRSEK